MRIDNCRYCGAELIWRKHSMTGRYSPLDAKPWGQGNIMLHNDGRTYQVLDPAMVQQAREQNVDLYTNHVGTCLVRESRENGRRTVHEYSQHGN